MDGCLLSLTSRGLDISRLFFCRSMCDLKRKWFRVDVKMCVLKRVCSCHLVLAYLEVLFSSILVCFEFSCAESQSVPLYLDVDTSSFFTELSLAQVGMLKYKQTQNVAHTRTQKGHRLPPRPLKQELHISVVCFSERLKEVEHDEEKRKELFNSSDG